MVLTGHGELAEAIDAIGKATFYERMVRYLHRCMTFDNVIVIIFHGTAVPTVAYREIHGPDVFKHLEDQYLAGAYLLDPIYHFHLGRGQSGLYRLLDVAPDQFRRSRYFTWYYGRIGIIDEISAVLTTGEMSTVTVSMGCDRSSGQMFTAKSEAELRQHEPVILSLLRAHWNAGGPPAAKSQGASSLTDTLMRAMKLRHGVALSQRQAEVALLILRGHSSPSIGLHLNISPQTVKVFRKQLYGRCNLSSQAELFALMMPLLERADDAG
jgi:DNA-binding CsgD family transcriptional regulator